MPVCLQIGNIRTVLFDVPDTGKTMRITLPELYKGLPLKAEPVDINHSAYENPKIPLNDVWPCILTESNTENENNTQIKSEIKLDNVV